jgi:uncharacterized protein YycO
MATVPSNARPGDFGLVPMGGETGKVIRVLQYLDGTGFANYEHAFLYIGNGEIIEATPKGALRLPCHYGNNVYWSSGIINPTPLERTDIVDAGISFVGTPYSFVDYASLVAKRLHIPAIGLDDYIASTGHMICSQLVAASYDKGGYPLFATWTGNVTPGDLDNLLNSLKVK